MDSDTAIEGLIKASARFEQQAAELAAEGERYEAELETLKKENEEARRRGEHGRDWKVLQQRMDLGQTTEFAVVQGVDLSSEARAVRKQMGETLGKVMDEQEREGVHPAEVTAELVEAQERLVETLRQLQEAARASGL